MSFLNSVLSSIGSPAGQGTPAATNGTINNRKRKAEDSLQGPHDKILKNGAVSEEVSRSVAPIDRRPVKTTSPPKLCPQSPSKVAVPTRDNSKSLASSRETAAAHSTPNIIIADSAKAPKKGSYAEIMARAKASQAKPPAVGVISHKPKDKIAMSYKKELKMRRKAIRNRKLGIKEGVRPGSTGSLSSNPATASSDRVKASQPAYKGTAKPKLQPTYKGTMKDGSTTASKPTSRDQDSYASRNRYNEYAATDEEDLDDIEEDDYGSEESDDMEAGFSDVEQEESAAAKAARKEDEEEARLEAKLKSEKEERKRKLEAMAKKAKPQRY